MAASFITPQGIRELRDLTRYRRKLTQALSSEKNRTQKGLEDANVKISSVLSDTFGVSGSRAIEANMDGKLHEEEITDLAKGKLKSRKEEIREALVGYFQDHHRFMIRTSLKHIKRLQDLGYGVELKKAA